MSDIVQKLVGALNRLYVAAPTGLDCNSFHHSKGEFHSHSEPCKPAAEYLEALAQARAALSEAKAGGWQPIEQASDEDKLRCWVLVGEAVHLAAYIVISFEEKRDLDGRYIDQVDHDEYWMDIHSGDPLEPTHFQPLTRPLPAPPAQRGEG